MKIVCDPGRNMLGTALTVLAMTVITPIFANDGLDADTAGDQQQMPGDIEEILVTARRREQNAQDIPISLYALAGKDLATFGIQSLEDIRDLVAGVEIIGGSPGAMEVSVRGVSNLNGGRTAAIGYYLDEAPLSSFDGKLLPDIALWDIERVEFLRGPQGTLFGEGSMGGTIRVITNKPDYESFYGQFEGRSMTVKDGGSGFSLRGMLNIPLGETVALRAVVSHEEIPGWIDVPDLGLSDTNELDQADVRLRLGWQATDRLTIDLTYLNQDLDLDSTYESTGDWVLDPQGQIPQAGPVFELSTQDSQYDLFNLTAAYIFESFTLVSATSFYQHELRSFDDFSPQAPLFFGGVPAFGNDTHTDESDLFTQDFRLVSNGDRVTDWTMGVYFKSNKHTGIQSLNIEVPAFGLVDGVLTARDADIDSWAVYGDVDRALSPNWSLQLGGRYYTDDRKANALELKDSFVFGTMAGTLIETEGSDSDFAPHLGFTWQQQDHVLYTRLAKGFRSGDTNEIFSFRPDEVDQVYAPETLWTIELGSKNELANGHVQLNAYLYFNDWSDIQVTQSTDDGLFLYTSNVGAAESYGGEFELRAVPSANLTLSFNLSYTRAEFTEDLLEFGEVVVKKGNELPFTPRWSMSTSIDYRHPLGNGMDMVLAGFYSHREKNFSDASNTAIARNDAYDQVRLIGGVEGQSWAVRVIVDNALNDDASTFRINPASAIPLTYFTQVRPRTYGLEVRWAF